MTQWKYKILFTASIINQILKVYIFLEKVLDMLGRQCGGIMAGDCFFLMVAGMFHEQFLNDAEGLNGVQTL